MKTSRHLSRLAVCVALGAVFSLSARGQVAFRLEKPAGSLNAFFRSHPTSPPPFYHWDLREFPGCVVPYSFHNGTPDIAGLAEFTAIDSAFQTWQLVTPSIIFLSLVQPGPGASCPGTFDQNNMIGWDNGGCGMPGDDIWCPGVPAGARMCGARVGPNVDIICPGPDGYTTSSPNNCRNDDACLPAGGGCACGAGGLAANTPIIGPGPNGVLDTIPNNCNAAGDDGIAGGQIHCGADGVIDTIVPAGDDAFNVATSSISSGPNGIVETTPNSALPANVLAVTFIYGVPATGRILESDILFNDTYMWQNVAHGAAMGGNPDVRSIATHEIGHFLGLHHNTPGGSANPPGPIMEPFFNLAGNANHVLAAPDRDGINWIYTPDLGDAPDPWRGTFNEYQSLVHSNTPSRMLNGQQLFRPARGPYHHFGWHGADPADALFRFEWLGPNMNDSVLECEALVPDMDQFDDGVSAPAIMRRGGFALVTALVSTDGNQVQVDLGPPAPNRYGPCGDATRLLYYNGYMDFPNNCRFDPADRIVWWSGFPDPPAGHPDECTTCRASGNFIPPAIRVGNNCRLRYLVFVPWEAADEFYCRYRVDYGEDEGRAQNISGDLAPAEGAAQFGEVEDYRCRTQAPFPLDQIHLWLASNGEVGEEMTITAWVESNFVGEPGVMVTFTTALGDVTYTGGVPLDPTQSATSTDENGVAAMTFRGDTPGPVLIEVSVEPIPGVDPAMSAYAFTTIQ